MENNKKPCYTNLIKRQGGGKMLCHLVINLDKELCTKSDDRTMFVQR